jgi:chemotaxis protein MotC
MRWVCVIGLLLSVSMMGGFDYAVQEALAQEQSAEPRSEIPHEMPADRAPDAPSGPSQDFGLGGQPQVTLEELLASEAKNTSESSPEAQKDKTQAEAPADKATAKDKAQAVPISPETKTAEDASKIKQSSNRSPDVKAASPMTPPAAATPPAASDQSIAEKEKQPPAHDKQAADVKPASQDQHPAASKASLDGQPQTHAPSSDPSQESADVKAAPDSKTDTASKTDPDAKTAFDIKAATENWLKAGPPPKQPYQWVRLLENVQNQIITGNRSAHLVQRQLIADIGAELLKAPDSAWKDPRNARAVVTYVLSGGDPRVMVKLIKKGEAVTGISDVLLKGLFAYAKGQNKEALEVLETISARSYHPGPGGQLALAQATLMAKRDARKALAYLDEARLLSPGTLVEEAALRRTVPLAIGLKDYDRLVLTMSRYLRRFDQSVYASTFHWSFARGFALSKYSKEEKHLKRLSKEIDLLEVEHKKIMYKVLAEQGILSGNLRLAQLATEKMAALSKDDPQIILKSQLYEATTLLFGEKYDYAVSVLKAIDAHKLNNRDRDILKAALVVAKRLREPVSENAAVIPPQASAAQGKSAEMDIMSPVIKAGRTAIAKADELLNGTGP